MFADIFYAHRKQTYVRSKNLEKQIYCSRPAAKRHEPNPSSTSSHILNPHKITRMQQYYTCQIHVCIIYKICMYKAQSVYIIYIYIYIHTHKHTHMYIYIKSAHWWWSICRSKFKWHRHRVSSLWWLPISCPCNYQTKLILCLCHSNLYIYIYMSSEMVKLEPILT